MIVTLDNIAERYGILPSVALRDASTLDLEVIDISAKYIKWVQSDKYKQTAGHSEEYLLDMINRSKGSGISKSKD